MLNEFFKSVLPEQGKYICAYLPTPDTKKPKHEIYNSLDGVLNFCAQFNVVRCDAWFALSSYAQGWHKVLKADGSTGNALRTQENTVSAKALWLDIDVGLDKHGNIKDYPTREAALKALRQFCLTLKLPKPWIVGSGKSGLHVYWAFTQSVPTTERRKLAARLHAATLALGLNTDSSRTQDCASILRCPTTWNTKGVMEGGQAHEVQILVKGTEQPFAYYQQQLDGYEPVYISKHQAHINSWLKVSLDMTGYELRSAAQLAALAERYFPRMQTELRNPLEIARGCKQIKNMNSAKEPVWYAALSVLRFCEKGYEAAEILSPSAKWRTEYHIGDKWAQLEQNGIKPAVCGTFAKHRPEMCEGCQYRGSINSPIGMPRTNKVVMPIVPQLASTAPEQTAPATPAPTPATPAPTPAVEAPTPTSVEPEQAAPVAAQAAPIPTANTGLETLDLPVVVAPKMNITTEVVAIPEMATPKARVSADGIRIRKITDDGPVWAIAWEEPIYPVMMYRVRDTRGAIDTVYVLRRHTLDAETKHPNGYHDIEVRGEALVSDQTFANTLAARGVLLTSAERKNVCAAMIDLVRHAERCHALRSVDASNQLGWSKDRNTFLLGGKLYFASGEVLEYTPFGKAASASEYTQPVGDLNVWKQAAAIYNRKGMEWAQAIMAAGFASPIMCMGAMEKAATLFVTGDASAGKSAAAELAVSIFGNPQELRSNQDDTYLSRIEKLGIWKNIAVSFDEMTNMSPRDASQLAYQITQGRGKDRMSSDGTRLITNDTRWSCLPVLTANDSIYNALAQYSNDPTPQMIRILEVKAKSHKSLYSAEEMVANSRLLNKRETNYGVAGDVYMRYVVANQDAVQQAIEQFTNLFRARTGLTNEHRFWVYMCARMITGLWIARELGLVNYDLESFIQYLCELVQQAKRTVQSFAWQPSQALEQFLAEHIGNRIVVTASRRPKGMTDNPKLGEENDLGYVVTAPVGGREVMLRYELDEEILYISTAAFKQWCGEQRYPYIEVMQTITQSYTPVTDKNYRTDLGRGTRFRDAGRPTAIGIKYPKELINQT